MRDVAVTCGSPRTERRPASLADGYSFYRWPGATDGPEQPSGLKTRTVEAANFSGLFAGRIGRDSKPPPQFGQRPPSFVSAQARQKVHSKLQIIASRA